MNCLKALPEDLKKCCGRDQSDFFKGLSFVPLQTDHKVVFNSWVMVFWKINELQVGH